MLGASLACLMILLFLGSIRSMFVIALTIPLSIATAFVLLYMTGHTINIMTLSGLALAVGTRWTIPLSCWRTSTATWDLGKSVSQAAGDGAKEVAYRCW